MSRPIQLAKSDIQLYFRDAGVRVFTGRDLAAILRENRERWKLRRSLTVDQFLEFLIRYSDLRVVELRSELYPDHTRFTWGDASPFEIALSVRPRSYFTHGSAVFLHALTDEIPKTLYINTEQSPKPTRGGSLSQASLDLAFSRDQRQSKYLLAFDEYQVVLVSGKFTNRLEVTQLPDPTGTLVDVTKLERTLIDITVRPAYAGGVYKVLDAFKGARERPLSTSTLVATLKRLEYVYPYHQALGFYMQRAGFDDKSLAALKALPRDFDFYLTHGIRQKDYDADWRLFIPKGM